MVSCPYFTTNFLHITQTILRDNNLDSFIIYMCVDGDAKIKFDSVSESIAKGETILIPAALKHFSIESNNAKLLEIYV